MCTLRYLLSYWLISHLVMRTWALAFNGGTLEKTIGDASFKWKATTCETSRLQTNCRNRAQKLSKSIGWLQRLFSDFVELHFSEQTLFCCKKNSAACYLIFFANKLSSSSGKAEIIQLRLFASSSFPRKKFKTLEVNLSRLLRSEDSNFCSSKRAITIELCLSKEAVGTEHGVH